MRNILSRFLQLSIAKKTIIILMAILAIAYICCLPSPLFQAPYSTVVTDRNGELLGARIASDGQWRFPPRTTVPEKVRSCLITFEDRHFYHHWGVNPFSIARALYQNLRGKRIVSGGSTLTMQTIRLSRNQSRTISEKIIEMIMATRLEFSYSKEEILALYVSHAPFGGNVVGLDAAAWRYFGHSVENLSWAEAATLAVLPNAPSMIHLSKSRNQLFSKRNRLLKKLYDEKKIDSDTYELAVSEPLTAEPHALPQVAPYLVNYFYKERKGKITRSTLEMGIQQRVESIAERWSNELSRSDIRNMAVLVIDIPANEVIAYCGNTHYLSSQEGNQVDVIQSPRSTGSILKPFLYAAMLKEGTLLPHTLLPDIPININGFTPQNFNMQYEGAVPASEALARSLNIPAVYMLQQYGIAKFQKMLQQWGISTINRPASHYGLSLILGGAEATLWDVTNAYKRMAENVLPTLSQRKKQASLIMEEGGHEELHRYHTFLEQGKNWQEAAEWGAASYLTLSAITEVNRPEEIDWKAIPSMQTIAWKTGTSYGFRDAWAVGVTQKYAVGVWVGNATGEGKPELVGARTAGPVLFDVFNTLPSAAWFKMPDEGMSEVEVCKQSGHLKGRFCDDTEMVAVPTAGLRSLPCPYHHQVTLSADEMNQVYENSTSQENTIKRNWFTLPPVQEWYYKQHHPEYQTLPPFKSGVNDDAFPTMQFIYPSMNAQIKLPKQLDGSKGSLTVELAHSHSNATVFWHLDNHYLTATQDFHKITLQPSPGKHSLTVVDNEGNTVSTTFYIKE